MELEQANRTINEYIETRRQSWENGTLQDMYLHVPSSCRDGGQGGESLILGTETVSPDTLPANPEGERIPANLFSFTSRARNQFNQLLNIPGEFIRRLPTDLSHQAVNYCLTTAGPRRYFHFRLDSRNIRATLSNRYTPFDDHVIIPMLQIAIEQSGHETEYRSISLNPDDHTEISCRFNEISVDGIEAQRSRLYGGFRFLNSETGLSAIHIYPVVWGAAWGERALLPAAPVKTWRHSRKNVGTINTEQFLDGIQQAYETAQYGLVNLRVAQTEMISQPAKVISEVMDKTWNLPSRVVAITTAAFEQQVEASKFDVLREIIEACQQLPIIERIRAEQLVANWAGIYNKKKATRIANMMAFG